MSVEAGSQTEMLPRDQPIAVVGMSALFPGALTTESFWRDILEGKDRLTEVPRTHWLREDYFDARVGTPDHVYTTRGGFLGDVDFAPLEFGMPPSSLSATDTAQLLALVAAKRVLQQATRGKLDSMDRSRMSVILGVASATELVGHMSGRLQIPLVERAMRAAGVSEEDLARTRELLSKCYTPWQETTFPGLLGNVVAGRVANKFDLGGTNMVIDAACASALGAVAAGVNELVARKADLVVTGGVDALNDILMFMCFAHTGALSQSGDCRPFSSDADGTLLGEGVGMIALKRLEDAERDKDPIFAVLRGLGSSSDGRATSIYAPLARGQANALRRAYASAGYGPETVGLVEAHGTATKAGDAAEFESLRTVFEEAGARSRSCALGSVKSQIGHTKAAAGAAGLIKAVLALHHKVLPPTIKVTEPNPAFKIEESPFYLSTEARPWIRDASDPPRRASVSALGFGGTNFHIALEEYTGPSPRPDRARALPTELVLLGASSRAELAAACRALSEKAKDGSLPRLAKHSQRTFDASSLSRVAVIADSDQDLADKLGRAAGALQAGSEATSSIKDVLFGEGSAAGPLAIVFPGQGSQYVNMARDLALFFPVSREVWENSESTKDVFVIPAFTEAQRKKDEEHLTATENAQPAIVTASLSMHRLLASLGVTPACVGGHSLGEVTALAAAGVISPSDAIHIARRRGETMRAASRDASGAMTAVVSDRETVARHVDGLDVSLANDNAPTQVVLSGRTDAIEKAEAKLRAGSVSFRRLGVSTAFHSSLVRDAVVPFRAALNAFDVHSPSIPVYANATAAEYPGDRALLRDDLARAIAEPVRWREQIEAMYVAGARIFLEVGPDGVLTRLVDRCLGDRPHVAAAMDQRGRNGVTSLWNALATLSVNGVALDFTSLWEGFFVAEEMNANDAPKLTVKVSGANYGKPSTEAVLAAAPPRPKAPAPMAAPPVAITQAAPSTPATADAEWLRALGELHAPAIAAQREYERVMAESHIAFLRTIEASYRTLAPGVAMDPRVDLGLRASLPAPAPAPPPAPEKYLPPAPPSFTAPIAPPPAHRETTVKQAPIAPVAIAKEITAPKSLTGAELSSLMLAVVAEKTGYPVEMVSLDMDLEGDLGIDSIKRVEILSALRERAPSLPEADTARLASQRTLRSILATIAGSNGAAKPSEAKKTPEIATAAPPIPTKASAPEAKPIARPAERIQRSVQRVVSSPALGLCLPNLSGASPIFVTPALPIARAIVDALEARGLRAEIGDDIPESAEAILFIGGLVDHVRSRDELVAVNRNAFFAARAAAARFKKNGGTFVTVQDTGGDFSRENTAGERAWLSGLVGLVRTAADEWPLAHVRAIDVERAERDERAIADAIVSELTAGGLEEVVGLRADGSRVTLVEDLAAAAKDLDLPLEENSVIVVSGGARGVTASSVLELARSTRRKKLRFALLGRTALVEEPAAFHGVFGDANLKRIALAEARRESSDATPKEVQRRVDAVILGREIRATLRALQELGAEARYWAVSVQDRASLEIALSEVRSAFGSIAGIVHGAGVLEDAFLENKTDEQFDRVFGTKVNGLSALLDATAGDPLRMLCLFSSIAARAGNAGQSDYAMANEVLNVVAMREAERRGPSCRVVSIGWGPWDGGMVTPSLKGHFESRGVEVLSIAGGTRAFVHELSSETDVDVVIANASGSSSRRAQKFVADVLVDRATYPELESHRVLGVVVLPLVLALEWFARLAAPVLGDADYVTFDDVRVLRGVTLPSYGERPIRLRVVGELEGATLRVELRDEAGARRYSATVRAGEPSSTEPPAITPFDDVLSTRPFGEIYGPGALFHGPHFQVLKSFEDTSDNRAIGALVCGASQGFEVGTWHIDVAAIDGALQLAVLHARRRDGGLTLPLRIGRVCCARGLAQKSGQLRAVADTRARSPEKNVCSVVVTNAKGRSVIELDDAEIYAFPGGKD